MTFEDKVKRFYNSRVDYDNIATVSRASTLVNLFPPMRGSTVVDLATGTGNVAFRAAEIVGAGGVVAGIDMAEELLRIAKEKKLSIGAENLTFRLADVGTEVFIKDSIDTAYCSFTMMLITNVDEFLSRIAVGLSESGFFAFTSASLDSYLNPQIVRAASVAGVEIPPSNDRFGTRERIDARLKGAGLLAAEIHELQYGKFIPLDMAKAKWDGRFWIHPEQTLEGLTAETSNLMKLKLDRILAEEAIHDMIWFEELVYYAKCVRAV